MLRHQSQVNGYAIHAIDGLIGEICDALFDDTTWLIRWVVIDTGRWLSGRKVLLPPSFLASVNDAERQFVVKLSRHQIRDCPDTDTDIPVSRQREADIYNHYGWPPYWDAGASFGMIGYVGYLGGPPIGGSPPVSAPRDGRLDTAKDAKFDSALRSVREVITYDVSAEDGEVGRIDDVLVWDTDWSIRYLVVDTGTWWHGNKVLVSPKLVQSIRWADRLATLSADREGVKASTPYDPSATDDPAYQRHIHKYGDDLRQ